MLRARLVCPFCREPFEGEARCPDHDLLLVPETELEEGLPREAGFGLSHGRGLLLLASLLTMGAFFAPFFVDAEGNLPPVSALGVALAGADSLWACFFAPALVLTTLLVRSTPTSLVRARLALFCVSLFSIAAPLLALRRGAMLVEAGGSTLSKGAGAYALIGGLALMALASVLLGRGDLASRRRAQ